MAPPPAEKTTRGVEELERRAGRENGRFWLYFQFDRKTGALGVETSWLPSVPQVTKALRPLGFRRRRDGAYRVVLSSEDASDDLRVVRLATKALGVLMAEGYF
ncbi:MAG: hypothetical protein WBY94_25760 [Polyangiaceae bacterium]